MDMLALEQGVLTLEHEICGPRPIIRTSPRMHAARSVSPSLHEQSTSTKKVHWAANLETTRVMEAQEQNDLVLDLARLKLLSLWEDTNKAVATRAKHKLMAMWPSHALDLVQGVNDTWNSFQCANKGRSVTMAEWKAAQLLLREEHAKAKAASQGESDCEDCDSDCDCEDCWRQEYMDRMHPTQEEEEENENEEEGEEESEEEGEENEEERKTEIVQQERALAFAMATHDRLSEGPARKLLPGLVCQIVCQIVAETQEAPGLEQGHITFEEHANLYETTPIDHTKIYEAFKNVPIQESKDMRKWADMPKDIQEYYKNDANDEYIDISSGCGFRLVKREDETDNI
jgi:hypothetical protein